MLYFTKRAEDYSRVAPAEIEADEKQASTVSWDKNGNLGRFTNFVNLMDMAAIAVPSGILRCQPIPAEATGVQKLSGRSSSHRGLWSSSNSAQYQCVRGARLPSEAVSGSSCLALPVP